MSEEKETRIEQLATQYQENNKSIFEDYKKLTIDIDKEIEKIWIKILKEKKPHKVINSNLKNSIKTYYFLLIFEKKDTFKLVCNDAGFKDKLFIKFKECNKDNYFVDLEFLDECSTNDNADNINNQNIWNNLYDRKHILEISKNIYDNFDKYLKERNEQMQKNYQEWIIKQEKLKMNIDEIKKEIYEV